MTDIIDRIDALVDEQLEAGEPENGWDYGDPEYPKCPHCGRDWHGLPINRWGYDAVMCEGSTFIGPMKDPWGLRPQPRREIFLHVIAHMDQDALARLRATIDRLEEAFAPLLYAPSWRFSTTDWYLQQRGPIIYDEAYRLRAEPPVCLRSDINWTPGPHNWHYEMQRPPLQFPRNSHPRYVSPTEELIRQHWDEFTAPEHPLPKRPEFDFTKYDLDPVHGVFAQPSRRGRR